MMKREKKYVCKWMKKNDEPLRFALWWVLSDFPMTNTSSKNWNTLITYIHMASEINKKKYYIMIFFKKLFFFFLIVGMPLYLHYWKRNYWKRVLNARNSSPVAKHAQIEHWFG
jgi:cytochrome c1